jgi:hypothetical protein
VPPVGALAPVSGILAEVDRDDGRHDLLAMTERVQATSAVTCDSSEPGHLRPGGSAVVQALASTVTKSLVHPT